MHAKARRNAIIAKELRGEVVLYDEQAQRAYELNAPAATVWKHCNGKTSVGDLATAVAADTGLPADEEIVHLALAQLSKAGLLETPPDAFATGISRRQLIHRLGLAGVFLLPMVSTLVAPSPAMAQSKKIKL